MNDIHSLTGSYVSDALDEQERNTFDQHLESCASCRDEVAELREAMAGAGDGLSAPPPPMLRSAILSAIAATPMLPAQEETPPPATVTSLQDIRARRRPVSTWMAAAAAVLAVGLGGVAVWQQGTVASVEAAEERRVELLSAPDLQVDHTTLDGSAVAYLVSPGLGEALLTAAALPDPGEERSWQVWVMQDDVPRSGAVIDEGGKVLAWVTGVAGGEALAITNEPRGGSPAPTGTVLAAVVLQGV